MMLQQPSRSLTDHHVTSSRPTDPGEDPQNIRRELVKLVDQLDDVRARKLRAAEAADAARSILDRAGLDVHTATTALRALEQREAEEIEDIATATAAEIDAACRRLAETRKQRAAANADLDAKTMVRAAAARGQANPAGELAGLQADEDRLIREIETWRARAAAHPLPEPQPIEPAVDASYGTQAARAYGYATARDMTRAQFLASLPGDVRKVVETDEAEVDACVALVIAGNTNGAIGRAYALHARQ